MRGFTLVEIVVVAGIIAVVSAILAVGQSTFNRTILLKNTAADVALALRNAQVYGISSRTAGTVRKADYGLQFTPGSSFIFFADTDPNATCTKPTCKPGNGLYCDSSSGSLCNDPDTLVQTFVMNNGMTISDFCVMTSADHRCNNSAASGDPIGGLAITFGRPNTSAAFVSMDFSGTPLRPVNSKTKIGSATMTSACIIISSPQGTTRVIKVSEYGEIVSTKTTTCP